MACKQLTSYTFIVQLFATNCIPKGREIGDGNETHTYIHIINENKQNMDNCHRYKQSEKREKEKEITRSINDEFVDR